LADCEFGLSANCLGTYVMHIGIYIKKDDLTL